MSLGGSGALHGAQLRSNLGHLRPDPATIRFDLRFAWSTRSHATGGSTGATAGLPRQRLTPSSEAGQQVLHLRQTDLRLSFSTSSMLSEDVQDEPCSVDNFDLDDVLESPQLTGTEFTVTDDRVRAAAAHEITQFIGLSRPHVCRWVRCISTLHHAPDHGRPRGFGELCEFSQRSLRVRQRSRGPHPDQQHPLQSDAAVLDLRNILEFGR